MADANIDEGAPLIFHSSRIPTRTDNRTQFEKRLAVWLILLAVACERFAFYSLAGNLVLFLTSNSIKWTSLHSVYALFWFFFTSYASSLIFSWISDGKLGRANTILIGFILYISGYVFIPLFSTNYLFQTLCDGPPTSIEESESYFKEKCSGQITAVLIVTAIGAGAVQANMAVFGAEQIQEPKGTTQYFDKYYVAVNAGGLLSFGVIAYIQQNIDWCIGHVVSTALLGATWLLFLIGYKCYIHIKPHDSVITKFFPVLFNAFQTRRKHRRSTYRVVHGRRSSIKQRILRDQDDNDDHLSPEMNDRSISFFDYARVANHGRFQDRIVNDIKSLQRIILMFLLLIPYWLIYLQSDSTFIVQGVHMKVPRIDSDRFHMPIIWLSLADQIIIIFTIFILNTCVYKRLHVNNRTFSMKWRIVIGMICATLSMCITGIVEIFRQDRCNLSTDITNQTVGNTTYTAADMSVFYQFPQYLTMGLSEVFTSVASLEFAYLAAPQSAQTLVMSLRFSSVGLSSLLSSAYLNIYESMNENFTMNNLECKDNYQPQLFHIYFFVLAGIQAIFIFIFLGCDYKFQILKASQHRFNTDLFMRTNARTSDT